MDFGLRDRVCVVTGASRGIGEATAVALARERARLLLIGRRADALERVAEAVRAAGAPAGETLALDVTEPDAAERVVAAAKDRLGGLDVLVNNAGTSAVRSLELQLAAEPEPDLPDLDLSAIKTPTTVAVGTGDVSDFQEMAEVLTRQLPNATLHQIEGAGHLLALERPDEVAELILR